MATQPTATAPDVSDGGFDLAEILRSARDLADVLRRLCPTGGQTSPGGWTASCTAQELGDRLMWLEGQLDPLESVFRIGPDHIVTALGERSPYFLPLVWLWELLHKQILVALYGSRKISTPGLAYRLPAETIPRAIDAGLIDSLERAADELERVLVQNERAVADDAAEADKSTAETLAGVMAAVQVGAPGLADDMEYAGDKRNGTVQARLESLVVRNRQYIGYTRVTLAGMLGCKPQAVSKAIHASSALRRCMGRGSRDSDD